MTLQSINVKPILESLNFIQKHRSSVARFGDGEIDIIMGLSIPYQKYNKELALRLKAILQTPSNPNLLVCLPDVFRDLHRYNPNAQLFWKQHFEKYHNFYEIECKSEWYGSTFLSRPYIDLIDKSESEGYFLAIKKLWKGKDVLIVEGETSRSGLGNDLFSEANSVSRIICPSKNAYDDYDAILQTVKENAENRLILAMLGPTAKLLAVDLSSLGYQVIDLGHIDSEYEWYQMNATHKVKFKHKHTAEHNYDRDIVSVEDKEYFDQILAYVGVEGRLPSDKTANTPRVKDKEAGVSSQSDTDLFERQSNDLISIIVPVYNVEKYLRRCLDSLLKQTYSQFEVLLINDGSTDSSSKIAMDYAAKDVRFKVFHQKNAGPSVARNYGIDLAQGQYLTFVDSDDFVETTYLEHLYETLVKNKADISAVNFTSYNEERHTYMFFQTKDSYFEKNYSIQEWLDLEGESKYNFHLVFTFSPMKLFKRELFNYVRYPVGRLREDDATIYKLYLQANKIAFSNEGSYFYSQRPEGLSRGTMREEVASMISNAEERIALITSLGYHPQKAIEYYVSRLERCQEDALRMGQMATYYEISAKLDLYRNHKKNN
ncbi:SP_1767 family glycosyltransferase [Streptococcus pluranimalium]|uniref:Putative glycosyltransferase EpsJ n=1 Tax=Streptococcus pluranimalium TaxID=82348 RepID=A0A345VMQ9_9STRE|nr:SP_1767 family glycosyltransferase [Streptococcus pluranimalium]AXJ14011.1 putative glycosyltransferase EpsJ [Streptococcus pluranimalium]